jgi:hypothetical protein
MVWRLIQANRLEGAFLPSCDDVPPESATGEMVERGEPLGEEEGRFKGGGRRDGEGQILGHGGHGSKRLDRASAYKPGGMNMHTCPRR